MGQQAHPRHLFFCIKLSRTGPARYDSGRLPANRHFVPSLEGESPVTARTGWPPGRVLLATIGGFAIGVLTMRWLPSAWQSASPWYAVTPFLLWLGWLVVTAIRHRAGR